MWVRVRDMLGRVKVSMWVGVRMWVRVRDVLGRVKG